MDTGARRWWLSGVNDWGAELLSHGEDTGRKVKTMHVEVRSDAVRTTRRRLMLATGANGPLDPAAAPETVGGLTLPHPMAVAEGELFLGDGAEQTIKCYDPAMRVMQSRFALGELLPRPASAEGLVLAAPGGLLVAAWRGGRGLVAIHIAAGLTYDAAELPPGVVIVDVCSAEGGVVILAGGKGVEEGEVWFWRPGRSDALGAVVRRPISATEPVRVLADRGAHAYVFDRATGGVARIDLQHGEIGLSAEVDTVRDAFEQLSVEIEKDKRHGWRFRVPPDGVASSRPTSSPFNWPVFDPQGTPLTVRPDAPVGAAPYQLRGTLEVGPLDSRRQGTVWDRILIDVADLPPGSAVEVATWTSDSMDRPPEISVPWSPPHRVTGLDDGSPVERQVDFAVLSSLGRYLWLRLTLEGGTTSPDIRAITLVHAGAALTDYLPAVYREADQYTRFLQRFLGALEVTWRPLDDALDNVHRELRPATARSVDMLNFLATWFDEPLVPEWGSAARRRAVAGVAKRVPRCGTPDAVQQALSVFVANRWGVQPASLGAVPFIWEHFRSRTYIRIADSGDASEEAGVGTLFGEKILQRLRIGASRLGVGRLRDLGSPATDPVTLDAHRFSVFVPAALLPGDTDVRGLQNVIDRECPAHAVGSLVLVEPRFRVGLQATLGLDTALGAYPQARLAESGAEELGEPTARLNYNCVLADFTAALGSTAGGKGGALPWRLE